VFLIAAVELQMRHIEEPYLLATTAAPTGVRRRRYLGYLGKKPGRRRPGAP